VFWFGEFGVGFFHILMKWPTSFDAAPNNLSIDSTLCAQLHLLLWAACLSSASARNKKRGCGQFPPGRKRKEKIFRRKFFPFSTFRFDVSIEASSLVFRLRVP
jgi:hypothetical protein